ncbi:uncharacterized protein LOC120173498 [Hibiscus syriacus]|uniref:uncharacterized protein LOC120173498 n=1 Tax=Hibiscus syriacus TaxID=106335 RepID=UPI0019247B11|nr:uncharacterized protein LOC120173498 [Hibiscus syriacus]
MVGTLAKQSLVYIPTLKHILFINLTKGTNAILWLGVHVGWIIPQQKAFSQDLQDPQLVDRLGFELLTGIFKLFEHIFFDEKGVQVQVPKIALWIAMTVTAFLVPTFIVHIYGEIAHFGAGVFLLVQLVSVISFITWLNDCCQSDKISEKCRIHVMSLATAAYVICIVGIIMMYVWYAPEPSCLLNIFFITWKLVLIQLMTSVSLHPKVFSRYSRAFGEYRLLDSWTHGAVCCIHMLLIDYIYVFAVNQLGKFALGRQRNQTEQIG